MIDRKQKSKMLVSSRKAGQSRIYHRRLVLDVLRKYSALSKAELARETALTPPTIANIIDELKAVGYVRETGRRSTPRGQPPVVIEIDPDGGYTLGVRIDRRRYDVVVSDLLGNIRYMVDGLTPEKDTNGLIDFVTQVCETAILSAKLPKKRFLGAGLVTPGPFDTRWPKSRSPGSLPGFQTRSITAALSDKLRLPVLLENDAAAAAIGEQSFGCAKNMQNFFYVFIAEGIGAGLVLNAQLYRGATGNAGEFGHLIVDPNGKQCYCGNTGCLGQYLSLLSLKKHLNDNGVQLAKYGDVVDLLEAGNKHLLSWVENASSALRIAIASVENLLEPEAIILGGTAPFGLLAAIREQLEDIYPSINSGKTDERIIIGKNPRQNIAQGAAAIPIMAATSASSAVLTSGELLPFAIGQGFFPMN